MKSIYFIIIAVLATLSTNNFIYGEKYEMEITKEFEIDYKIEYEITDIEIDEIREIDNNDLCGDLCFNFDSENNNDESENNNDDNNQDDNNKQEELAILDQDGKPNYNIQHHQNDQDDKKPYWVKNVSPTLIVP